MLTYFIWYLKICTYYIENDTDYFARFVMCLKPLPQSCPQQIFELSFVVGCNGPQIIPGALGFKYDTHHWPFAGIGFHHISKLEFELHWALPMVAAEFHIKEVFWDVPIMAGKLFSAESKNCSK